MTQRDGDKMKKGDNGDTDTSNKKDAKKHSNDNMDIDKKEEDILGAFLRKHATKPTTTTITAITTAQEPSPP